MQKATEALKQEMSVVGFFWKPSKDCLAACLEYLKGKGDLEGAVEIIKLVRGKGIVSVDIQERLLNHIKDGESISKVIEILGDAMDGDEETSNVSAVKEGSKSINMLETNV
ncbi:uncharacterized protein LOC125419558 [Ziziphus jujuba]|uniref:Uncharacterized protein LOC125419558 n=1 Tax=Ziziphus jujuba TaxID=326968 RepID=A0ABM3ZVP3_ZIZJJ|nr:uncharacterized protein LOC125419558 [Ziziphus jujuba]